MERHVQELWGLCRTHVHPGAIVCAKCGVHKRTQVGCALLLGLLPFALMLRGVRCVDEWSGMRQFPLILDSRGRMRST